MAIKYSDLNKKMNLKPLDETELMLISAAENFIDEEIIRQFSVTDDIRIDREILEMRVMPETRIAIVAKEIRRKLMEAELKGRYTEANWEILTSGETQYVLRGKEAPQEPKP